MRYGGIVFTLCLDRESGLLREAHKGCVATFENQHDIDFLGLTWYFRSVLCSHFEQLVDYRDLLSKIRTGDPPRLTLTGSCRTLPHILRWVVRYAA